MMIRPNIRMNGETIQFAQVRRKLDAAKQEIQPTEADISFLAYCCVFWIVVSMILVVIFTVPNT